MARRKKGRRRGVVCKTVIMKGGARRKLCWKKTGKNAGKIVSNKKARRKRR